MNEIIFDLLDRLRSEYTDGYLHLPIPSPIDDEVGNLVDLLIRADSIERAEALSLMTDSHMSVLRCYAERIASRAMRERRPELISHALSALAIASKWAGTPKISTTILSLLYRSGELIGRPAITESTYPIEFDNPEFVEYWNQYRARSEDKRTIEVMSYAEGSDQDGFRYERTDLAYNLQMIERAQARGEDVSGFDIAGLRQRVIEQQKRWGGNVPGS